MKTRMTKKQKKELESLMIEKGFSFEVKRKDISLTTNLQKINFSKVGDFCEIKNFSTRWQSAPTLEMYNTIKNKLLNL